MHIRCLLPPNNGVKMLVCHFAAIHGCPTFLEINIYNSNFCGYAFLQDNLPNCVLCVKDKICTGFEAPDVIEYNINAFKLNNDHLEFC